MASIPALSIAVFVILRKGFPYFLKVQQKIDQLNGVVRENLSNIRVVKSFVREDFEARKFVRSSEELRDMVIRASNIIVAMLSLIQADVVDRYGWISLQEFTDIVAISQMTPGPIGINSATYIGYTAVHNAGYSETMSILGSCLTTFAVCLPSFLLVLLISYFFAKFRNNKYVEAAFLGLRPATVGLIAAAALLLMNKENFIDYKSFLIFGAAFILTWKFKVHPILMIILAGIAGIILYW